MVLVFGFTLVWIGNPTADSISHTGIFKFGYANELLATRRIQPVFVRYSLHSHLFDLTLVC